jgi:hypothetical protein
MDGKATRLTQQGKQVVIYDVQAKIAIERDANTLGI